MAFLLGNFIFIIYNFILSIYYAFKNFECHATIKSIMNTSKKILFIYCNKSHKEML